MGDLVDLKKLSAEKDLESLSQRDFLWVLRVVLEEAERRLNGSEHKTTNT